MEENILQDKKSLKSVIGKTADFTELAKDCVAFANAKGGRLYIGIEDDDNLPPADQIIQVGLPERIIKRINELTYNVALQSEVVSASNGGEYIILNVLRTASSVASTTKGLYYIRDDQDSRPVLPDELIRLVSDKTAYCWETKVSLNIRWDHCDKAKLANLIKEIRNSERVSSFVKGKSDYELLVYYLLVDDNGLLTNLGILWIGKQEHRARLLYAPVVQYIKYDAEGNKVNKIVWDDYSLNPMELIESIWQNIPDWRESYEVSEGLWRKNIPAYDEKVVREVLCNALAHRPYTTRGDVFINIYPDKMAVVNPGLFPLGVSATNILQKTIQRNEHLSRLLYVLKLMEAEGSGYDLMYETLLTSGKSCPIPFEGADYIEVTIDRKIINKESVRLCEYITDNYKLSQKNLIALGIIIQSHTISAIDLSKKLQLATEMRLRDYVGYLVNEKIVETRGRGKGVKYFLNPNLIINAKSNIPTTLKTIEPHRLKALIQEDLKYHPWSSIAEISSRLPDVDFDELQGMVRKMAIDGLLDKTDGRKFRKYNLF